MVQSNIDIFGSQPYLSIKTFDGKYFYDNFDFQILKENGHIHLMRKLFLSKLVDKIGVATNNLLDKLQ